MNVLLAIIGFIFLTVGSVYALLFMLDYIICTIAAVVGAVFWLLEKILSK